MTESEMRKLGRGDVVRHARGDSYVVISVGAEIVAVREIIISNPTEWTMIFKNELNMPQRKQRARRE